MVPLEQGGFPLWEEPPWEESQMEAVELVGVVAAEAVVEVEV